MARRSVSVTCRPFAVKRAFTRSLHVSFRLISGTCFITLAPARASQNDLHRLLRSQQTTA